MAALFPDMPIGHGFAHVLALADRWVVHSAQPLVSLSPFIIPLLLAIGWKLAQWFGFGVPLLLALPVVGALMTAEHELQDRALLPLPGDAIKPSSKGTWVRRCPCRAV